MDGTCADETEADRVLATIWQGLTRVVNEYLDGITLQDVLDMQTERYANDYVI